MNTEQFTVKARSIYGNKYDYSKSVYSTARDKVVIVCPEHGEFLQNPEMRYKYGCRKCGHNASAAKAKEAAANNIVSSFIAKHGDQYDYSLVEYKGWQHPVTIVCREHGPFNQLVSNHRKGMGCPRCGISKSAISQTKSTKEFIAEAKNLHSEYYTYDRVVYHHSKQKVIITCPVHGDFEQTPYVHLAGKGCPRCSQSHSKNEAAIANYLDLVGEEYQREVVIPEYNKYKKFDFFLPRWGIYVEYDGVFHHKPLLGVKRFEEQQYRDRRTNEWCANNNVTLHRVNSIEEFKNLLSSYRMSLGRETMMKSGKVRIHR